MNILKALDNDSGTQREATSQLMRHILCFNWSRSLCLMGCRASRMNYLRDLMNSETGRSRIYSRNHFSENQRGETVVEYTVLASMVVLCLNVITSAANFGQSFAAVALAIDGSGASDTINGPGGGNSHPFVGSPSNGPGPNPGYNSGGGTDGIVTAPESQYSHSPSGGRPPTGIPGRPIIIR